jgi:L-ascorbate metabolism protein UlaG (beta-lactamase superfamily)
MNPNIITQRNVFFVGILMLLTLFGCTNFGARTSDEDKERFSRSENFNLEKGVFVNEKDPIHDKIKDGGDWYGAIKEYYFSETENRPDVKIPYVKPDFKAFLQKDDQLKVIWMGHSTIILNMDGVIILIDPMFGPSVSPVSFMFTRFQNSPVTLEELPEIDIVLISHDHFDHLDMSVIKFLKNNKIKYVTPLGVGLHLKKWGIPESDITERDWWESVEMNGIHFTATPSKHASGRVGAMTNETLWASWVIKSKSHNLYFSGDSGYAKHFKEIGERLGPFDLTFMESGQYDITLREKHLMPADGIQAYKDLKGKNFFPIHWGMFALSMHAWYDPVEQLYRMSKEQDINLLAPKLGELVVLEENKSIDEWWTPFISEKWLKKNPP